VRKYHVYAERPVAISLAVNIAFVADIYKFISAELLKEGNTVLTKKNTYYNGKGLEGRRNTPRLGRGYYMHNI
jgi:hypothetical protein